MQQGGRPGARFAQFKLVLLGIDDLADIEQELKCADNL